MTRPRVVVVGDIVTDVIATGRTDVAVGSDTTARIVVGDGGAGGNVAAWLCALGVDTGLVARVGDDGPGRDTVRRLTNAGVTVAAAVDAAEPTGTVVALIDGSGERTMLTDRGANRMLRTEDMPETWFRPGAHLHLSGYVLFDEPGRDAGQAALQRAATAGMTISVDPASWAPLERFGAQRFLAASRAAGLALPNADEARVLTGATDMADAAGLLAGHYGAAVVTCGANGAAWSDNVERLHRRPASPSPVTDTTGAGDAFTAAFLSAWLDDVAPASALAWANQVAAQAIRRRGARPARRFRPPWLPRR